MRHGYRNRLMENSGRGKDVLCDAQRGSQNAEPEAHCIILRIISGET